MHHKNWICPKCGHGEFEAGALRGAGGFWAAFFDVSNKGFTTVACGRCSYTELYRTRISGLQKVFDFLSSA